MICLNKNHDSQGSGEQYPRVRENSKVVIKKPNDPSIILPGLSHKIPLNHHSTTRFLWFSYRFLIFPRYSYGFPIVNHNVLWFSHRCLGYPRFSYGFPTVNHNLPMVSLGFPRFFLWFSYSKSPFSYGFHIVF